MLSSLANSNPVLLGLILAGWIIPLLIGIAQIRRGRRPIGALLAILGVLWALPVIAALLTGALVHGGSGLGATGYTTFDPATSSGPSATIVMPWQGRGELQYRSDNKQYLTKSTDGRYPVPAGTLQLSEFTAYSGPDTTAWQGRATLYEMDTLTLTAGQQYSLKLGPPYVAQVQTKTRFEQPIFELEVKDVGGHKTAVSDPEREIAPGLQLLDKQGKVVWQDKFAYG